MTKKEKVEAYEMLLNGCTFQEVGENFGVSRQYIQQLFPFMERRYGHDDYIYPNIANWLRTNRMNLSCFARKLGTDSNTVSRWFRGINNPKKDFIDAILTLTGMTYEVAFSENETTTTKDDVIATLRNELCQQCGKYKRAHEGACDGCR